MRNPERTKQLPLFKHLQNVFETQNFIPLTTINLELLKVLQSTPFPICILFVNHKINDLY